MKLFPRQRHLRSYGLSLFVFLAFSFSVLAQELEVKGTLSDPDGNPLIGATVMQKGTTNGTVTDFDGNYAITVPDANAILVYSYTGYTTTEIEVASREMINVELPEDSQTLDQVVVIGYGSQKRSDITGSVSSVDSEDLEKAVFNNVDQLLQGRSAGVLVTSGNGAPGAGATIRIRGNNSLQADNGPLYVVDGIPIQGSPTFNPQDIANLEVLKDASATAIYGSRGANGVILVTTKRGKSGQTIIEFDANTTSSNVISQIDVLNGQEYAEYRNEANEAIGNEAPFDNPAQYAGQGFNWQDEILETGQRTNVGLNVRGGQDNVRFFVSGNYLLDNGIIIDSKFSRANVRANLDIEAFDDRVSFEIGFNAAHRESQNSVSDLGGFPSQLGPVTNALLAEPIVPSLDFFGETGENEQFYNPYLEVTAKEDRGFNTDLLSNVKTTVRITDELSYVFNGGINFRLGDRQQFYPSSVSRGILSQGQAIVNSNRAYDYVVSNYLSYDKEFGGAHNVSATLGLEYSEFNNYSNSGSASNFEEQSLGLENLEIGTGFNNIPSERTLSSLQSGFLRVNYSYKSKYLITLTGRADGSSRFATNEKWGYFPSGAIGWRVSQEDFLSDSRVISNLKLRVSYGATGTQSITPYRSLARYGTTQYPVGQSPSLGYIPNGVANPNLKWETTKQFNAGFDLGLFNNRFEIIFDYFVKTTDDLLSIKALPPQSGFGGFLTNIGSIQNKGVELGLNAYVFDNPNFSWNTGLNLTSYKNKVLDLGGDEEQFGPGIAANFGGNAHIYRPGDEFGLFYGLVATGLIQESDLDGDGIPFWNNDKEPGHWKFEDTDANGVINGEDRQVIGNPNPDLILGWNNDFSYKNFSLNVFIQGTLGNDILNALHPVLNSGFNNNESYKNQTVEWYNRRWTPSNPTNDIRYPSINSLSAPVANFMIEDGSYLRLKNLSLRYLIPFNSSVVSTVTVYATGTNLITITDYTGYDPEVSALGSPLAPGVDLGVYPRQRAYTLGLTARF